MLIRPTPAGKAVLQLVLDRLYPLQCRSLWISGVTAARADPEAHRQQILHDRRARRELQEDITKLSSRAEIDRRHAGPSIPVTASSWANVTPGRTRSSWNTLGPIGVSEARKRSRGRESGETRSGTPRISSKKSKSPRVSSSSTPGLFQESRVHPLRRYHATHSRSSREASKSKREARVSWVQRMEGLHLTSTSGAANAAAKAMPMEEVEEADEVDEALGRHEDEAKVAESGEGPCTFAFPHFGFHFS